MQLNLGGSLMKFITSRILMGKAPSIEEAAQKAQKADVRSLDEILKDIKTANSGKTVKTASAGTSMTKTTQAKEPKVEAAKEEEIEVVEVKEAAKKVKEEKEEKFEDRFKKKEKKKACASLKMAKKADFRNWAAESIIKAWAGCKDVKGCVAKVQGHVSDPNLYCGLLQIASAEAEKMVKAAKTDKSEVKVAAKGFEKLAKLSKEQLSLLRDYFTPLYGEKYVDSLLGDY